MGAIPQATVQIPNHSPLKELSRRLEALCSVSATSIFAVSTGLPSLDATLPHGGLERGKVHEFIGVHRAEQAAPAARTSSDWSPPLTLLIDLARRAVMATGD